MLNRKLSNYLFYFIVLAVIAIVYLVRTLMLGNMEERIDTLDRENIRLQSQIAQLEQTVEEHKDTDISYLYELYDSIPAVYSATQLQYNTIALCELAGIGEEVDTQRTINYNNNTSVSGPTEFISFANGYQVVQINLQFTTQDLDTVFDFLDVIQEANQLYVLNNVSYTYPDGNEFVAITISYYAFYQEQQQ